MRTENGEALKSRIPNAIRCAKAALLLSSLKSSPDHRLKSPKDEEDEAKEREMEMIRAVTDLKTDLVRQRLKCATIRLCSFMDLALLIAILFSLWTVCLMLVLESL